MQRRPTSFDIAALAGVSQPTVSRALAGNPSVSAETRARVLAAAAELNYKVDKNASGLRRRHSRTLALLFFEEDAHDMRQLKLVFPFTVNNVLDLGVVARRRGLGQTGVRNLAGILLGFRIPKGNRTSNWAAPRLSPAQITYAVTDAWACRELYLRFESLGLLSGS